MSFDQAYELCYAAKKYMVPNLVEKCSQFMWKDLIPENVCRALEFANLYEDVLLKVTSTGLFCNSLVNVNPFKYNLGTKFEPDPLPEPGIFLQRRV